MGVLTGKVVARGKMLGELVPAPDYTVLAHNAANWFPRCTLIPALIHFRETPTGECTNLAASSQAKLFQRPTFSPKFIPSSSGLG